MHIINQKDSGDKHPIQATQTQNNVNKKKQGSVPKNNMFSIPPFNKKSNTINNDNQKTNDFINNFFTFLQYVLNDIETFDRLENINVENVKKR